MLTRKMLIGMGIVILAGIAVPAWGITANWHVDPNGNDACDCDCWADACKTIKRALERCSDANDDIIDVNSGTYTTGPMSIDHNNIAFVFKPDVTVEADSNLFGDSQACLFSALGRSNITWDGNDTLFLMMKDELPSGEERHAIWLRGSINVEVSSVTCKNGAGDGICLDYNWWNPEHNYCENIYIHDVTCDGNRRNGISVCCANDVIIKDCVLKNTDGAPKGPWAGIDFEPSAGYFRLNNILMRDTIIEDNAGKGIQIGLEKLRWQDPNWQDPNNIQDWEYTDITIEDCFVSGGQKGIIVAGLWLPAQGEPNGWGRDGTITITNVTVQNTIDYGLYVSKSSERGDLTFSDCVWANAASSRGSWPLEVQGYSNYHKPGGISFNHCQVFDYSDRPAIKLVDKKWGCNTVYDIHGDIYVTNDKRIPADPNDPNDPNCLFDWSGATPNNVDVNVVPGLVDSNDVLNRTAFEWYSSIQAGIDDACAGDVIEAAPCRHYETIDFNGLSITVRSFDPNDPHVVAATIIDANAATRAVYFHNSEDANSLLSGFTVMDATYGIDCSSASPAINRCQVRDNLNDGISLTSSSATVKNNWVYDNSRYGIHVSNSAGAVLRNNTLVENTSAGIYVASGNEPNISNCILWDNNNDLYGCTATYSCIQDGDSGTGNVSDDPCFMDAASADFHLTVDSPCFNSGDPNATYTGEYDIDGCPRLLYGRADMGADEFQRVYNVTQNIWYVHIQDAIHCAASGDEIIVYPGTFYESLDFEGKAITVHSSDPNDPNVVAATIIDANAAAWRAVYFHNSEDANSVLSGFTVTDASFYGIYCSYASPKISKCIIRDNVYGVRCYQSTSEIDNCLIEDNTYGIYPYGANSPIIKYNKIRENNYDGIYLSSSAAIVKSNWIYGNGRYGIGTSSSGSALLRNNTIVGNVSAGVYTTSGDPNMTNCIVWDNSDDLYGCTATYSCIQDGDSGTGNVSSDPCFVDADANDFHLLWPNSPCIDAGDPSGSYSGEVDIDGEPRVMRGRVDIGADEVVPVVWYVDATDGNDNNDGRSWETAFATIQRGINEAIGGDIVEVNEGTYYETVDFDGKAITLRSTDPNDPEVVAATIIDGNGSGTVVTFDSSEDANSVLKGFTITGGSEGGIYCYGASPTIANCIIKDNGSITSDSGGMYNHSSSPTVTNCVFSGNISDDDGGGMFNRSGSCPAVTNCVFSGNISDTDGGGMSNHSASTSPTVINCVFYDNSAGSEGGGMHNDNSSPTVVNCLFYNNTSDEGGGMCNDENCSPTITNCTFFENYANDYGGGIYNYDDSFPELCNCIFWGNDADDNEKEDGPEIYNDDSEPSFEHCCIEGGLNGNKCGGDDSDSYGGNISDDPNFVDTSDPNGADNTWGTCDDGLRLPSDSPCVDEGEDDCVDVTTDIKGSDREIGPYHPDMGAYEYDPNC